MSGPGRITKIMLGISRQEPVAYLMRVTPQTADQIRSVVHRMGVIGKVERKWAFCRDRDGRLVLLPTTGPRYLFRGQTQRHTPCYPSIYRHFNTPAHFLHQLTTDEAMRVVADAARTFVFYGELDRHPVMRWAAAQQLHIGDLEIAQHYGIRTSLLDVTESPEVALFFATHERKPDGTYTAKTTGTGYLYVVDKASMPLPYARRFSAVAIQPFARPFQQWAWSCELFMGESFETAPCMALLEFEQSESLAQEMRAMAEAAGPLFPSDPLACLAEAIRDIRVLPMKAVQQAAKHFGAAYSTHRHGEICTALRKAGYSIVGNLPPIYGPKDWDMWAAPPRRDLNEWKEFAASKIENLMVRGGRQMGRPLQWGIDGHAIDRFRMIGDGC